MKPTRSWTVGSDSGCDIVVDQPTVSARHCRLHARASGYDLEDLGSTNGTYVNGERITGRAHVTPHDTVTLGQSVVLPWSKIECPVRQVIRIGRADDNDIVYAHATVSAHHAQITIDGSAATIEDLGSSNGTAIGTPENRITSARLRPTDSVYLGDLLIPAAQLLPGHHPVDETLIVIPDRADAHEPSSLQMTVTNLRRWGPWIAGCAACLIILAMLGLRFWDTAEPERTHHDPTDASLPDSPKQVATSRPSVPAETPSQPPSAELKIEDAIFCVIVCDHEQASCYRLGTAWAVSRSDAVTTASVVKLIEDLEEKYPLAFVLSDRAPDRVFTIRAAQAHPEYQKLFSAFTTITNELQLRRQKLREPDESTTLDELQQEVIRLEQERFATMDQLTYYDVALLQVEGGLPKQLELSKLRSSDSVKVIGAPFPPTQEGRFFQRSKRIPLVSLEGAVADTKWLSTDSGAPSRLLVRTTKNHAEMDWRGSPLICDGTVIGLYSHPTFSADGKQIADTEFDATVVQRLYDVAPHLSSQSN
jgi:hypothetical protein